MSPNLRLRAPIVLVHGFLGFDRIGLGPLTLVEYFPGVAKFLRSQGNRIGIPRLMPMGSVAERALQLRTFLNQRFPKEPVHLIAHSMGGLDSRYMTSCLDMHDRVLSLTTLGTPHRGTSFADWGIRRLNRVINPFLEFFGQSNRAILDLTTERCARLNETARDVPGVRYFSVGGQCNREHVQLRWRLASDIVREMEGPNDGVVSLQTARYGEHFDVWNADHMNLVNRPNRRAGWHDRSHDFSGLVSRLAGLGY
jgi:triacylglycerol lipase